MVFRLSPEFQLAAACAMWPPSDRRSEAIRTATAGPLHWPRFLGVVERHRIIGLVRDGLTRARAEVPPEVISEIEAKAAIAVRENLVRAAEALRLQRIFEKAKVPILFVKGASLTALAFGNLGLSGGQDIDVLVPMETLSLATALIADAGYRRFDPPPNLSEKDLRLLMPLRKDFTFVHQTKRQLVVELHWRLFLNPHAMDQASFWPNSQIVPLTAAEGLRTMGNEDLFAYLCLHGALHWWNRLKWLADINALMATAPAASVEHLIRASEAKGAGRATAQAALLCQRLFGTSLPDPLMKSLRRSAAVRWLEATALGAMTIGHGERDPHDVRFGTTRGSASSFLLSTSWRYRLAELNIQSRNQADVLATALPERLRFLYPILRLPLWVGRHAVKRSARK